MSEEKQNVEYEIETAMSHEIIDCLVSLEDMRKSPDTGNKGGIDVYRDDEPNERGRFAYFIEEEHHNGMNAFIFDIAERHLIFTHYNGSKPENSKSLFFAFHEKDDFYYILEMTNSDGKIVEIDLAKRQ